MRALVLCAIAGLCLVACDDSPTQPEGQTHYFAPLRSSDEVPANTSAGLGQATFVLNAARTQLTYELVSRQIDNVVMAHIHIGAVGVNGPVVQFLFGPVANGGGAQTAEPLSSGTIDGSQFTGPLAGRPFSELVAAIEAGNAYVNVHTNDGVPPTSNVPGDLPAGEIRGQIRLAQ